MSFLSKLERKLAPWAIPNLTTIFIAGQVLLFFMQMMRPDQAGALLGRFVLIPSAVVGGEIWRLFTFLFIPPPMVPIFLIIYWMLLYQFGTALENQWGVVRYNAFLLIGYLANVAAVFIALALGQDIVAQNSFLYGTVFLAFARLFPNFILHIFFILPIQVKWLALLAWIGYGYSFIQGSGMARLLVVASVLNYLLFFGREHWRDFKSGNRRRSFQNKVRKATQSIMHQCTVCELNSENSPRTSFRYCSKCDGQCCYCPSHIHNHEHIVAEETDLAK